MMKRALLSIRPTRSLSLADVVDKQKLERLLDQKLGQLSKDQAEWAEWEEWFGSRSGQSSDPGYRSVSIDTKVSGESSYSDQSLVSKGLNTRSNVNALSGSNNLTSISTTHTSNSPASFHRPCLQCVHSRMHQLSSIYDLTWVERSIIGNYLVMLASLVVILNARCRRR